MTGRLVIAKGFEDCLYVYPARSTGASSSASRLSMTSILGIARSSLLTAGAVETELDSAGRISVPQHLRDYAHLSKDVAVTGNGDRIEVWTPIRGPDIPATPRSTSRISPRSSLTRVSCSALTMEYRHTPVLLAEVMQQLSLHPGSIVVDCT